MDSERMGKAREAFWEAVTEAIQKYGKGINLATEAGLLAAKEFLQEPCKRCEAMKPTMRDGKLDFVPAEQPQPEPPKNCKCGHSHSEHVGTVPSGSNAMPCIRCECRQYEGAQPEAAGDLVERMKIAHRKAAEKYSETVGRGYDSDEQNTLAMTAALAVAQEHFGREREQAFWVIELFNNGKSGGYWNGASSHSFVTAIDDAVQFRRRQDAVPILSSWHWKDCEITEHLYLASRRTKVTKTDPAVEMLSHSGMFSSREDAEQAVVIVDKARSTNADRS